MKDEVTIKGMKMFHFLELCKSSNIWEHRVFYRKIYWH